MKKGYAVTFTGHHIINVEAENEEEAREMASDRFDFDGDVDWETDVEENGN